MTIHRNAALHAEELAPTKGAEPVRAFLVGCPRSGTTLFQAMLAAHPDVLSFPETHFFGRIRGRFRRSRINLASPRPAIRDLREFGRVLGVTESIPSPWRLGLSLKAYGAAFADLADEATQREGKSVWVDKSPPHLHLIDPIASAIPDARFLHIVRNGRNVVSSFYAVCKQIPGWVSLLMPGDPVENLRLDREDQRVLFAIVDRWNHDVTLTAERRSDAYHCIIAYEHLVDAPERELSRVCAFLGLAFDAQMLDYATVAPRVIGWRMEYEYMRGALQPLRRDPSSRLEEMLPPHIVERLEARLLDRGNVERIIQPDRPSR